jgi:hypothetical protein
MSTTKKKLKFNLPQKIDVFQLDLAALKFFFFNFNCNFNFNSDFNNFDLIIHVLKREHNITKVIIILLINAKILQ